MIILLLLDGQFSRGICGYLIAFKQITVKNHDNILATGLLCGRLHERDTISQIQRQTNREKARDGERLTFYKIHFETGKNACCR